MNISYIKKQILEKVTIKNSYYNDIFHNYIKFLEKNFLNLNEENIIILLENLLKTPLIWAVLLFNNLMDQYKLTNLYIKYLPTFPFRHKYNTILNHYKHNITPLKNQWILLHKRFSQEDFNLWNKNFDKYHGEFFQSTKNFLQLKFLTSRGKTNIRNYINNNNYAIQDL
jgi:hypothetical protein